MYPDVDVDSVIIVGVTVFVTRGFGSTSIYGAREGWGQDGNLNPQQKVQSYQGRSNFGFHHGQILFLHANPSFCNLILFPILLIPPKRLPPLLLLVYPLLSYYPLKYPLLFCEFCPLLNLPLIHLLPCLSRLQHDEVYCSSVHYSIFQFMCD